VYSQATVTTVTSLRPRFSTRLENKHRSSFDSPLLLEVEEVQIRREMFTALQPDSTQTKAISVSFDEEDMT